MDLDGNLIPAVATQNALRLISIPKENPSFFGSRSTNAKKAINACACKVNTVLIFADSDNVHNKN